MSMPAIDDIACGSIAAIAATFAEDALAALLGVALPEDVAVIAGAAFMEPSAI